MVSFTEHQYFVPIRRYPYIRLFSLGRIQCSGRGRGPKSVGDELRIKSGLVSRNRISIWPHFSLGSVDHRDTE
jgi:hypothetical protein